MRHLPAQLIDVDGPKGGKFILADVPAYGATFLERTSAMNRKFLTIVRRHLVQVTWRYVHELCTETEYHCAIEYLEGLEARLERHYARL